MLQILLWLGIWLVVQMVLLSACGHISSSEGSFSSHGEKPIFVPVTKGVYVWGSPPGELGHQPTEDQQTVEITYDFEVSTTETTQLQWVRVMKTNPSKFSTREICPSTFLTVDGVGVCPTHPVEQVSWEDVQQYLVRLNGSLKDGYHYRLPTEAEWEYFARANTSTAFSFGDSPLQGLEFGWFRENSPPRTSPVGLKRPNPWGLFDVHGNNWEWTQDLFKKGRTPSRLTDPKGGKQGEHRVVRGGSWFFTIGDARSARRAPWRQSRRIDDVSFRLVRVKIASTPQ